MSHNTVGRRIAYTIGAVEAEIIWLVATLAFTAGEIATLGFFLAPFAVGALGGLIVALAGGSVGLQLAVGAILSAAFFVFITPLARRHMSGPPPKPTNTQALIGMSAIVVDPIVNDEHVGSARIGGEVWTARSADGAVLPAGAKVTVVEINGATAVVSGT